MRRRRRIMSIVTAVAATAAGAGLTASGASADPQLEYVQLGDSYSAGNGAGSYTGRTCWRSPENYGARVARRDGADYVNVACSGGRVADILNPRPLGDPTWRTATFEVPGKAPNVQHHWMRQAKQQDLCGTPAQEDWYYDYEVTSATPGGSGTDRSLTATVRCQLTAAPQINAVTKETDAVFVTVGGNDIGFTNIVAQCMVLRAPVGCESAIETAKSRLPELKQDTKQALAAVGERTNGKAEVYLLGYPYLLDTDSYGIPEGAPTYDFGAALAELQLAGDRVQREAMQELDAEHHGKGGFTFVDVKPAWDGHEHGLDPSTSPDDSDAWLVPVFAPGRAVAEWVHPTDEGYAASAEALWAAMD